MKIAWLKRRAKPLIVLAAVLAVIIAFLLIHNLYSGGESSSGLRALVADSLAEDYPNPELISHIVSVLKKAGYTVDVYYNESVSLDLFSRLSDYNVVILRVHGGKATYRDKQGRLHKINGLFTGLSWRDEYSKYKREWIATRAYPYGSSKAYLAVLPGFFEKYLSKPFKEKSVVVVASCYSLYTRDIADALGRKGLWLYVGWEGPISLSYMDEALRMLIDKVFLEKKPWTESIIEVNKELGPDPEYHQYLKAVRYKR